VAARPRLDVRPGLARGAEGRLPAPPTTTGPEAGSRLDRPGAPSGSAVRGRRLRQWTITAGRLGLAALGGYAEYLTAPPHGWWPCGIAGVALAVLAAKGTRLRTGALVGAAYGAALFLPLLTWVATIGLDAYLLLSLAMVIWLALLGAGMALVTRLPAWPLWSACLWVTEEWARDRVPFGGFTWGRLAFGQTHSPMTPIAALGGAPLLTFAVALAGTLLAFAVSVGLATLRDSRAAPGAAAGGGRHVARRAAAIAAGLAGSAALVAIGAAVPVPTGGQASRAGPASVEVAAIQGNVPRLGLASLAQGWAVLRDHAAVTEQLARAVAAGRAPAPQLVVWPEDATTIDPLRNPQARALVDAAVRAIGRPTLVGAVLTDGPDHLRNAGIVWSPSTGPGAEYVKRHLVPFGEYVPFRSVLTSLVSSFRLVPRDFVPGHRVGVLQLGPARVGDVICFEVTFDGAVRDTVTGGGRLITVQTNDADYEHPGQPANVGESAQQLAIAQLRAVEHGRSVVVASTSGVSALIDPDGDIVARSPVFRPAVLEARMPLRDSLTLADRVGPLPEYVLAGLGLAGVGLAAVSGVAARRRRGVRPGDRRTAR
jgi:apolipoprotein N-acyltransferase